MCLPENLKLRMWLTSTAHVQFLLDRVAIEYISFSIKFLAQPTIFIHLKFIPYLRHSGSHGRQGIYLSYSYYAIQDPGT